MERRLQSSWSKWKKQSQSLQSLGRGVMLLAAVSTASVSGLAYELPNVPPAPIERGLVQQLQAMSKGIEQVADHAKKAIVYVSISKQARQQRGLVNPLEEFFFGPRFRDRGREGRRQPQPRQQEGVGSGFIVDLDKGYIVTNNHVIEDADEISLKLGNGETYDGKIVGRDPNTDIAVVQIKDSKYKRQGLAALSFADSDKVGMGQFVVAIGAPFRLEATLSFGVVSALGRDNLRLTRIGDFIQTDAAINPGNSGGPLLDMFGKVIGVNTAIYSPSGGYAGIGFAVPSNITKNIALQLINDGKVTRGYLGVTLKELDKDLAAGFDLPKGVTGALVTQVSDDSPAKDADLEEGDIIAEVNGKSIESVGDLVKTIGLIKPGTKTKLGYYRDGKKRSITIKIGAFPDQETRLASANEQSKVGVVVAAMNDELRSRYGIESRQGVIIVETEPGSRAERAGLREGDAILQVNRQKVTSPRQALNLMKGKKNIILRIERQGSYDFIALNMSRD